MNHPDPAAPPSPTHARRRRHGRRMGRGRASSRRTVGALLSAALAVPTSIGLAVGLAADSRAAGDLGSWGPVLDWGLQAKHMAQLPTGDVLVFSTGANARVWEPDTGRFTDAPALFGDLHCAGNAQLGDGRTVVLGGQDGRIHIGTKVTALFDPTTRTWTEGAPMRYARWYASVTTLPDGRVLSTSGDDERGRRISTPEVYDPASNSWRELTGAVRSQQLYPHMYVLPNGKVFEAAPGAATALLDVSGNGSWTAGPTNRWSTSGYSESSVMFEPGKVMRTGGGDPATNRTAVVDMTAPSPAWTETAPMQFPRRRLNLVILADGQVLALGGTAGGDDASKAVLAPELWNPQTRTWSTLAPMAQPRMYHSSAVLMPDGRVVIGGGEATGRLQAQVFTPPYLSRGLPRPVITSAPETAGFGTAFRVDTPNAADIASVALIRLGAGTHAWDQNQRYVPLTFSAGAGTLTVTAPANGNVAPPGTYFLVVKDRAGTPSVGSVLRVGAADSLRPGQALGRVTEGDGTTPIRGATVTAGARTATTGTDGRYTLADLPPGEQGLTVTAPGFARATAPVLVPPGGSVTTDFRLVPPGDLTGIVTDEATGAPIPDAVLSYPGGRAVSGQDGRYRITGAPSGSLELSVSVIGWDSRTVRTDVRANFLNTLDVPLTRSATYITGDITDAATKNPLAGVTVTVPGFPAATSDTTGTYRIDVPAGTYQVTATAPGYRTATATAQVSAGTFAAAGFSLVPENAPAQLKQITLEDGSLTHPTSGADTTSGGVQLDRDTPLAGAGSARFPGSTGYLEERFDPQPDLYLSTLLRVDRLPTTDSRVLQVRNGSTTIGTLQLRPGGRLRLRQGSTNIGAESAVLTPGTTYRVGVRQRRGSGGDAVLEAFLAPPGQGFGEPFARRDTGDWTGSASSIRIGTTTGDAGFTVDDVLLDSTSMPGGSGGDTPPPPPPPPPGGGTSTLTPTADAQTRSANPSTNYGTATTLRLRQGTATSPGDFRTHLRFAVGGTGGPVTSARLRLFVTDASAVGGTVQTSTGGWTETALTWANQPAPTGPALSTAGRTATGSWVEWDVTAAAAAARAGSGTLDLVLTTSSTDSAIYSSREGASPPQLVLGTG